MDRNLNAYGAAIAGMSQATAELLDCFLSLGDMSADSEAMADLAAEEGMVSPHPSGPDNPWGDTPVRTALSVLQANVILAQDFGRAFLHVASGEVERVIFGFAPVARAALENLARARWLLEPNIGVRKRVGRAMNDRLEGLWHQARLDVEDSRVKADARINGLIDHARSLGFEIVTDRNREWIEDRRPSSTRLMRQLFYDPEIGAPTYSFLSGITHGLPASLNPFFAVAEDSENPLAMWERREAVLDAHTVNLVAGLLVMGAVPVLDDQHRYLAVSPSQKTQHAARRALSQVQAIFH